MAGRGTSYSGYFVETYGFFGKTIVSFCISGGSGIESSVSNMKNLSKGDSTWLEGKRLEGCSSCEYIVEWINSLGLDVVVK